MRFALAILVLLLILAMILSFVRNAVALKRDITSGSTISAPGSRTKREPRWTRSSRTSGTTGLNSWRTGELANWRIGHQ